MTQVVNQPVAGNEASKRAYSPGDVEGLRQSWTEQGYFVLPGVVSREKLKVLHARIMEEFEGWKRTGKLFAGGGNISGHLNCFPGEESRFVYQELEEQGVIELIRTIFPKAVRLPNVGCNLNLPKSVPQHYHADRPFTQEFVICNIAVVDTDLANGAIDVLPGTQKKFYPFWKYALERAYRRTTRLPLKLGDVLVRSSNLWHRGMPNYTAVARPMLALTWEDGGSVHEDPWKYDDGKIGFRQNWYRSNLLGQLRERTFVAAPITYSAWRFARSLYGNKGY
jgi:Phytanoyl-CoA dioxygenase (PhyH)